jgi:hypothetical protein
MRFAVLLEARSPVSFNRSLSDSRQSPRSRVSAWLLLLGLVLGQVVLYLHQIEHELQREADHCVVCLVGDHLVSTPLAAIGPAVPAFSHPRSLPEPVTLVLAGVRHAFRARAPPRSIL